MVSVDVKHHVYSLILGCLKADNNKQSNQVEMNTSPKKIETCAKKTHVPELITVPALISTLFSHYCSYPFSLLSWSLLSMVPRDDGEGGGYPAEET